LENQAEKELIADIQKNPALFGVLFDRYYKPILGYIYRRTGNYASTQDICSETFLKALLNINKFRWKGIPVLFWLYRIANNEIQQYFRKQKYIPSSLDILIENVDWDEIDPASTSEAKLQAEKEMHQNEEFRLIQAEVQKLPVLYQEVLALRYFEQKSIKDIAAITGKKEGTIKSLLSRGIEKLREIIG
jgi:RNA polymerase sigma factor (sigma-70 family)